MNEQNHGEIIMYQTEDGLNVGVADDEMLAVSELLMQRNQHVYEELAK